VVVVIFFSTKSNQGQKKKNDPYRKTGRKAQKISSAKIMTKIKSLLNGCLTVKSAHNPQTVLDFLTKTLLWFFQTEEGLEVLKNILNCYPEKFVFLYICSIKKKHLIYFE